MTWYDILATISKLTELDELTIESCASALGCKFEPTASNRYHAKLLQDPFEYAELIPGSDKTILTLTFQDESAREEYAMRMLSLGKPIDIDMVSPSLADENGSSANFGWERKYSLCYEIGDRQIWFGIEETDSKKKLINIKVFCRVSL
jgi:hypothetical protein